MLLPWLTRAAAMRSFRLSSRVWKRTGNRRGIAMALKMTGMQQKRHLANLAVEFNKHAADIGSSPPLAPSAVVFPALYSIMRTASTGATA